MLRQDSSAKLRVGRSRTFPPLPDIGGATPQRVRSPTGRARAPPPTKPSVSRFFTFPPTGHPTKKLVMLPSPGVLVRILSLERAPGATSQCDVKPNSAGGWISKHRIETIRGIRTYTRIFAPDGRLVRASHTERTRGDGQCLTRRLEPLESDTEAILCGYEDLCPV